MPVLALPVPGGVSSPYGWRTLDGEPNFHNGVDFYYLNADVEGSTRVLSACRGVVQDVAYSALAGYYITVRIDDRWLVRYIHLVGGSERVEVGQRVDYGTHLATMGNSRTKYRHLHFDLFDLWKQTSEKRVDPMPYMTLPYPGGPEWASGGVTPIEEEEVVTQSDIDAIVKAVWEHPLAGFDGGAAVPTGTALRYANRNAAQAVERLRALPAEVWAHQIPTFVAGESTSAATMQRYTHRNSARAAELDAAVIAAFVSAALPAGGTFTAAEWAEATKAALEPLFAEVNANIDDQPTVFNVTPKEA